MSKSKVIIPASMAVNAAVPEQWIEVDCYTSSADEHGHSEQISLKVHPQEARRISKILADKNFPYETSSDLVRHAIRRHLEWLERVQSGMISTAGNLLRSIDSRVATSQFISRSKKTFEDTREHAHQLIESGRWDLAVKQIDDIQAMIHEMPDGSQHRIQMQAYYDQELAPIHNIAKQAMLKQYGMDDDENSVDTVIPNAIPFDWFMSCDLSDDTVQ